MNKLITSTLLTLAAVPFLMAAPKATKKAQNTTPAPAATSTMKPKTHRKASHVKKAKTSVKTATPPVAPVK
jgi:hypothetical protein